MKYWEAILNASCCFGSSPSLRLRVAGGGVANQRGQLLLRQQSFIEASPNRRKHDHHRPSCCFGSSPSLRPEVGHEDGEGSHPAAASAAALH